MPFLNIRDALVELKMNKAPRGIDDTTIMQHTFRYAQVKECFQQFRLVCKSWKHAIETMRFNRYLPKSWIFFSKMNQIPILYVQKYLRAFRKISFHMDELEEIGQHSLTVISDSVQKLNCAEFNYDDYDEISQFNTSFITKILQNSKTTLQFANIPILSILKGITFLKLRKLELIMSENFISSDEFVTYFPKILENNIGNLDVVDLFLFDGYHPVCEYIEQYYGKHCISGESLEDVKNLPLKIRKWVWNLEELQSQKYTTSLQYLHILIPSTCMDMEMESSVGWDTYQEIFDQFPNLKAIEIWYARNSKNFIDVVSTFPPERQQRWHSRIAYFQKRGIHLAKRNEIYGNENLKMQLAKEAGISWRFDFIH